MIKPRPYQTEFLKRVLKEWRENGECRQLVTLPTGAGKTICFALLAHELKVKTLILAHREELLNQAKFKIKLVDPKADVNILRGGDSSGLYSEICVASVQSAVQPRRLEILKRAGYKLVIIDEAHHATERNSYGVILRALGFLGKEPEKDKLLVGVTATAFRGDGVALGGVFDCITYQRSILALIKAGYLADARGMQIVTRTDLSKVHSKMGDFATNELSLAVNTEDRNEIVVESYLENAKDKKAVVFCCDVKHSQDMAEAFNEKGISAAAAWGAMKDRAEVLEKFRTGEIKVICNCNLLTEGFDEPSIEAVLLARPTKSKVLYIQMVGRGLRTCPGKSECLVIDFTDTAGRHNLCSLGSLAGDDAKEVKVKNNETLTEAVAEVEASEVWAHEKVSEAEAVAIDLFERSRYVWIPFNGDFRLSLSKDAVLVIKRQEGDEYRPFLAKRGELKAVPLSDVSLPVGYAQGVAEDWIRENCQDNKLIDRSAAWRSLPATGAQIKSLKRYKVDFDEGITRGEASELLSREIEARKQKEDGPATSKQIYYIRVKLHKRVPEGLTFAGARKMIAESAGVGRCAG